MKTKLCFALLIPALMLLSCKKDMQQTGIVSAGTQSNYSTDGVLTVQVSINPPVTAQSFIPNTAGGNVSYTGYDMSASKLIYIDNFQVTATYPCISVIGGVANTNGQTSLPINTQMFAGQPHNIPISIVYNNVDSNTTPTITTCMLNLVNYHTGDFTNCTLQVDKKSGSAFSMCLVNNIAQITFQNPSTYKVMNNGYVEFAEIVLTGDTSWTLNSLPLNYYFSDFSIGNYPTKVMVKYDGNTIGRDTVLSGHEAVVPIKRGFEHIAGQSEILKIYGYNMSVNPGGFFITEMGDLSGLSWKDGLGGLIPGRLNAQFYKEQAGSSSLHNYQ
ncbi:MAG: hypothetical protein ABJA35_13340 [Parafilimonas sp.]